MTDRPPRPEVYCFVTLGNGKASMAAVVTCCIQMAKSRLSDHLPVPPELECCPNFAQPSGGWASGVFGGLTLTWLCWVFEVGLASPQSRAYFLPALAHRRPTGHECMHACMHAAIIEREGGGWPFLLHASSGKHIPSKPKHSINLIGHPKQSWTGCCQLRGLGRIMNLLEANCMTACMVTNSGPDANTYQDRRVLSNILSYMNHRAFAIQCAARLIETG